MPKCYSQNWRSHFFAALAVMLVAGGLTHAYASVAVLVEMPYGKFGAFNPTGHIALYFDHICADTPVSLRPCRPGELGVVISRYDDIGELDWVAMPLIPYLYGVDSASDVPSHMDKLTALRMRDLYRREYLEQVAPDTPQGGMPQGNWYELVGSAFDRSIYGFQVATTADQDARMTAYFNDRPNVTRYEGAFRNCADFVRVVLNQMYPHAIRRNYVSDFGMTTPKSVARSFAGYARKHPELQMTRFRVPQLRGTLPRSMSIQGVTGSLLTRYGVPLAILEPHVTAVVFLAYLGKGRFAMPKDAPILDVQAMQDKAKPARPSEPLVVIAGNTSNSDDSEGKSGADNELKEIVASSMTGLGTSCAYCDQAPLLP